MPKVGFVSLGCPKNLVDSEVMMGILARSGYEITPRAGDADVASAITPPPSTKCPRSSTRSAK